MKAIGNCLRSSVAVLVTVLLASSSYGEATWLGTGSDIQTGANWLGGSVPGPTDANTGGPGTDGGSTVGQADFVNGTNPILNAPWSIRYIAFFGNVNSLSGTGTLTIGNGTGNAGNIDSYKATGPVTLSVANIVLQRNSSLYAGSGGVSTDLNITSTSLKWGTGGSSGNVSLFAVGGNLNITPTADFSLNTTTTRQLLLVPSAGKTITLAGGVKGNPSGTNRLSGIQANGEVGGKTILGNSTTWAGAVTINTSDIEINNNTSLGAVGSAASGYTQFGNAAGQTGSLVLTNNITVGDYIYDYGRSSPTMPIIVNKSGSNTMTGTFSNDNNSTTNGANKYVVIRSDGTAGGDLLTLSGTIDAGTAAGGSALAEVLVLRGAGNGVVSGKIAQLGTNTFSEVRKDDAGTWTLSNATNDYTGKTTVMAGTLSLGTTGSVATSPTIDVRTGAFLKVDLLSGGGLTLTGSQTLAGGGTVTGGITAVSGTTIAPGDNVSGIGTLTVTGPLSLTDSVLQPQLTSISTTNGGTNDKIVTNGALTTSGLTTVTVQPTQGYVGGGSYRLMDYSGAATNLANFSLTPVTLSFRQTSAGLSSTTNQLNLDVVGNLANLTWVGGVNSNTWVDGQADVNSVNWTGATGGSPDNHFYNGDSVTFGTTGTNSPVVNGTVTPIHVTFNSTGQSYTVSGSGTIAAFGDLTDSAVGNVTLSNSAITVGQNLNASNSGSLTFSNSTTAVTGNATLSGSGAVNISNSTSFDVTGGFNVTGSSNVNVTSGNFTVSGAATMNGSGTVTFSNSGSLISLPTAAINSGTVAINRTDDLTVAGSNAIATNFTGAGTFKKQGTNTIELTGDNSGFTGTMIVENGTLATRSLNALANTTVQSGATLDMGSTTLGVQTPLGTKSITISGSGVGGLGALVVSSPGPSTNGNNAHIGALTLVANATIRAKGLTGGTGLTNRNILWVDGPVTGGGNALTAIVDTSELTSTEIDFVGNGACNLGNLNLSGGGVFYVGGTTDIGSGGTINLGDGDTSGDPTDGTAGRLGIYGNTNTAGAPVAVNKPIVVNSITSSAAKNGMELYQHNGTYTMGSTIALNGGFDVDIWTTSSAVTTSTLSLTGAITGGLGNDLELHVDSNSSARSGAVQLVSNGNTYQGATIIGGGGGNSGVTAPADRIDGVYIGNGGSTGSIGTGDITIYPAEGTSNSDGTRPAGLFLNRTGTYSVTANVIMNGNPDVASVESIAAGDATMSGLISGAGRVAVSAGKLTLTNNNSYGGTTTVGGTGTLLVNGTYSGGGAYTVNSGGKLGGTGSVGVASVTVNAGGILAPGASIESLDVGSATISGTLAIEHQGVVGANNDLIDLLNVGGVLDITSATASFSSLGGTLNDSALVFATYGSLTGTAFASVLNTPVGYSINYHYLGNQIALVPGVAGDYNGDNIVDARDYVIWRKTPGSFGGAGGYTAWRQNYGTGSGAGSGTVSTAAVPEPASCGLVLCALLGLLSVRSRRVARVAA